jgi:NADH dehydrogenase FAD-containing subunit
LIARALALHCYAQEPRHHRRRLCGNKAAQELEHALPTNWNLTLISQENFITFNPLLPEVVGASILPGHVIAPHRQMIHCSQVCMAQVTHIDTMEQVIHYLGGCRYVPLRPARARLR